jgi:hypothetical protein
MRSLWVCFLLVFGGVLAFAQNEVLSLDEAIKRSMTYFSGRLPGDTKMVVLNFSAPTEALSGYIIEELTTYIVNSDNFTVTERQNLELLQRELNFQLSGEVSDETAQAIGQKIGAQTIISGSIISLGEIYHLRIRAIKVETAEVQGQQTLIVGLDPILAALLGIEYRTPEDLSPDKKIRMGFLNILGGAGSYTMGDRSGGITLTAGYVAALGLIIWDIVGFDYEDDLAGIPAAIGLGVAGLTAAYGFARPFIYHKPADALARVLGRVHIGLVSGDTRVKAVKLSYTYSF